MRHQPLVLTIPVRQIAEVEAIGHLRIEMEEVDRQDIVERVAPGVDELGVREDYLDQSNVQEIVGPLVGQDPL